MKTLYISYFGALKPLVQTQVIPYLRQLAEDGMEVTLVTFEEALADPADETRRRQTMKEALDLVGIHWHPLRYHKTPSLLATGFDVAVGIAMCGSLIRRRSIEVVHARSHVPGVMALALRALFGVKIVFDLRGLMAEEYVDAGLWRQGGLPYRLIKAAERQLFRKADAVVLLTHRVREYLDKAEPALARANVHIEVIPCCADLQAFSKADGLEVRKRLSLIGKRVMIYSGSTGSWYMLEQMIDFARVASGLDPKFHFLLLTHTARAEITAMMESRGLSPDRFTIARVEPKDMPQHLAAGDFAISFIKPCFSKISSSPTKIGEYLAAGLPIVCGHGVGDLDEFIPQSQVGVIVRSYDDQAYRNAFGQLEGLAPDAAGVSARCRDVAQKAFDLNTIGRMAYRRVYASLGGKSVINS